MSLHLYEYKLPSLRGGERRGLILNQGEGWGEIAPLPGFSKETLEEARAEALSFLRDGIEPTLPSVRFGVSCASRPFSLTPLRIPLCALNVPRPHFSTLKLKVGHLAVEEAVALTKQYVGRFRLRIDCNRAWNLDQALFFAKHFSPSDFEYLEEPLDSFPNLVRFSSLTQFPIGADESFRDSPYLEIPTLKAAIVKPTLVGSIPAVPSHISLVLSSSFESSLGILHIARLAAQSSLSQGLDTFCDDLLIPPLQRENGFLTWTPSSSPLDMAKLCLIASSFHSPKTN